MLSRTKGFSVLFTSLALVVTAASTYASTTPNTVDVPEKELDRMEQVKAVFEKFLKEIVGPEETQSEAFSFRGKKRKVTKDWVYPTDTPATLKDVAEAFHQQNVTFKSVKPVAGTVKNIYRIFLNDNEDTGLIVKKIKDAEANFLLGGDYHNSMNNISPFWEELEKTLRDDKTKNIAMIYGLLRVNHQDSVFKYSTPYVVMQAVEPAGLSSTEWSVDTKGKEDGSLDKLKVALAVSPTVREKFDRKWFSNNGLDAILKFYEKHEIVDYSMFMKEIAPHQPKNKLTTSVQSPKNNLTTSVQSRYERFILSKKDDKETETIYFGLIDYLQPYTSLKSLESMVKAVFRGTQNTTILPPFDYASRLHESLRLILMKD